MIATIIQEEAAQPPAPQTYYELHVVSPPAPLLLEHGQPRAMTLRIIQEKLA